MGSRTNFGSFGRPATPERYPPANQRLHETPPYSSGSPTPQYGGNSGSPGQLHQYPRNGLGHASAPQSHHSSPKERESLFSRHGLSAMPSRPSSQPTGPPGSYHDSEPRDRSSASASRQSYFHQPPHDRSHSLNDSQQARTSEPDYRDRAFQNGSNRDRPLTAQPMSQSAYSPPLNRESSASQPKPAPVGPEDQYWRSVTKTIPRGLREESQYFHAGYRNSASNAHLTSTPVDSTGEDRSSVYLPEQHRFSSKDSSRASLVGSENNSPEKRRSESASAPQHHSSSAYPPRGQSFESQARKHGEELHGQRFPNLSPDFIRRTGRASPFPQAVQGAQAQITGPSGNPGIKSEFGRMFSGLGSGVAGTPGGNGASTPSRQSPLPQRFGDAVDGAVSTPTSDPALGGPGSHSGRRGRRIKEEDGKIDTESADGRGTPNLLSQRGSKRTKHAHPAHHHHHHPQSHQ